jgi:hypothetical protein
MGSEYRVLCRRCDETFTVSDGGGFLFDLLHCERCGAARSVRHLDLGPIHLRYLKGLTGPYAVPRQQFDEAIQRDYDAEPLSEPEYRDAVSEFVGPCQCGGRFTYEAAARCPRCGSTDEHWQEVPGGRVFYD